MAISGSRGASGLAARGLAAGSASRGGAHPDVLVVGGGVIGLAIAWRCAQRGLRVGVVDPAPGSGASRTAAGMLAPVTELRYEGRALLALNLESARRYPTFAAELLEATGVDIGYLQCGTIQVAWDATDLAELRELHAFQQSLGVSAQMLTGREVRAMEPALAAGLAGGLYACDDHQVDNRALVAALLEACRRAGVTFFAERVAAITVEAGRATGVELASGDRRYAGVTVLAAGAWSGEVLGLPDPTPVRPVKGQTLRLCTDVRPITRVVRGSVRGHPVYLVPRATAELVVGASSEEAGFDVRPRAGAVYELLRDAQALLPELSEAELVEVSTGLRPGSFDNAPLLGPSAVDRLIVATGHYRNGILLTPVTGDEIARLIATGVASETIAPFDPGRAARASDRRGGAAADSDRGHSGAAESDPHHRPRAESDPPHRPRAESDPHHRAAVESDPRHPAAAESDPQQVAAAAYLRRAAGSREHQEATA